MSDGPVVPDTTPLITLAGVGLLPRSPYLYGALLVPEQVLMEYQAGASASDPILDALPWLHIVCIQVAPALLEVLDLGEAAMLTPALAQHARVVLLDEQAGHRVATRYGLAIIGSLGVLVRAKQAGLISMVRPYIDAMLVQGRRMSARLVLQTLQAAGSIARGELIHDRVADWDRGSSSG